jgi:excinuclease ABC subunit A
MNEIVVRGARQHNLRDVHVAIPREKLVVVTGPSGSGKTSLVFDVIYAEAQRRYVEGLSTYARQLFARLPRPDVDLVEGLSPALSVEQQSPVRNPRSTVGTLTEIHDYLRLLYASVGLPAGPSGEPAIPGRTVAQMVDATLALPRGARISVLAPVVRGEVGAQVELLARLRKEGFVRVRLDGVARELAELEALSAGSAHELSVVVDRLTVDERSRARLGEALELALGLAGGLATVSPEPPASGDPIEPLLFSERFLVPGFEGSFPALEPSLFAFNARAGACPRCQGLGEVRGFDPELVVRDGALSLREGAIVPWGKPGGALHRRMLDAARASKIPLDVAFAELDPKDRARVLEGDAAPAGKRGKKPAAFEGVLPALRRRLAEHERRSAQASDDGAGEERAFAFIEDELGEYMSRRICEACGGARLGPAARLVRVGGKSLPELNAMTLEEARAFLASAPVPSAKEKIARRVLVELDRRLGFLLDTGLGYLSLGRAALSLSGGETQRLRLGSQLGAGLRGVLYVLDEPTSGLHPADGDRLLRTLEGLRDRGNTLLVVEHDARAMLRADHLVDVGPGAGRLGGRVVAQGTPDEVMADERSVTGPYLRGTKRVPRPRARRTSRGRPIRVEGARVHNLRDVTVEIPVGVLTCVTGVSGSGKSSLVMHTLVPAAERALSDGSRPASAPFHDGSHRASAPIHARGDAEAEAAKVSGLDRFDKLIPIDQSPLGRSSRSNPATATGAMQALRALFAELPEARARGYKPSRFSFNVKGGRCEACRGEGEVRVSMHFLPDVFVECEVCGGKRFDRETLEVRYRGYSIADVLALPVADALALFEAFPRIVERLEPLARVGLGYLELGRGAATLSAGEAQRVKLARELGKRAKGRTLYVLDEPTRGLHFVDVEVLVAALHALVDAGHTVVVVEHHVDVVKTADHVIDMGPGGGPHGGLVVATGTPEDIAARPGNKTGEHLLSALELGCSSGLGLKQPF